MNQLSILLTASLTANLLWAGSAVAQETPSQASSQASVTQFLSDSAPSECTLQVVAIAAEEADQPTADILADVPLSPCEAVSGTDDGNSKNFNFLNLSGSNFYKIITESEPMAEATDETYRFSVEGVKVVPLDEAGNAANLGEVDYLFPANEQTCIADAVEQPRSVTCIFEVTEANNVLVGQLKYVW